MAADIIITAAHDALHVEGTPAVSPVFSGSGRGASLIANGSPSITVCGVPAFCATNAYGAAQLYPNLTACPTCHGA